MRASRGLLVGPESSNEVDDERRWIFEARRREKAEGRREKAGGRRRKAEWRREKGEGRRQEAGGRTQKAEGRRQEAGGRRQEAGGRRQKAEGRRVARGAVDHQILSLLPNLQQEAMARKATFVRQESRQ